MRCFVVIWLRASILRPRLGARSTDTGVPWRYSGRVGETCKINQGALVECSLVRRASSVAHGRDSHKRPSRMAIKTSTTKRRMAAPAAPCCPEAGDLVVLATANPMFEGGTTSAVFAKTIRWHLHQQRVHRPLRLCDTEGKVPRHHGSVLLFRFQPTTGPRCSDEANTRDREGLQLGLAADHHVRRKPTVFKQQGDWRQRQLEHGVRRQSRLRSIRHPACARGPREHRPVCIRLSKATVGAFASMRSSTFGKHRFWLAKI